MKKTNRVCRVVERQRDEKKNKQRTDGEMIQETMNKKQQKENTKENTSAMTTSTRYKK